MQRLYVGGLSHTVTQKDLKDRFGKFGEVQDVELRTRRDEEGVPYKTFGYININISEADLKKCMTVLNKSKWKGGTLQIEMAKESFLHRLTQERQEAMEQRLQPPAAEDKRQKLLDSLSKAGVDNFTMKAAVPGTEVPGHKDWVVSKFGRVLPILQLKCKKGNRARTVKYDPSKYSHNIRKLGPVTVDQSTPVTQLTWEVQGGDDDISRKRRGEFPPYEPPRHKKGRTDMFSSRNETNKFRLEKTLHSDNVAKAQHFTNGFEKPANNKPVQRKSAALLDSDDSDEEIRRLVAAHNTSRSALCPAVEEDNLEVVGLDYLVKSGRSRQQQKGRLIAEDEDDYDSADTDELFASRRPPPASAAHMQEKQNLPTANHLSGNNTDRKRKTKKKSKAGSNEEEEEEDSADAEEHFTAKKPSSAQQREDYGKQTSQKQGSGDKELESSASCSDSEYEAMFSNVTCLEISFTDLQRLAEESQPTSETTIPSILGVSPEKETRLVSEHTGPKKGTTPEEILASIMEDESTDDEKETKKRKSKCGVSTLLPAFQGTKTLNEKLESSGQPNRRKEREENGDVVKKQKLEFEPPQMCQRKTESKSGRTVSKQNHQEAEGTMSGSSEQDEEEEEEEEGKKEVVKNIAAVKVFEKVPNDVPVNAVHSSSSGSDDDDEDEEEDDDEEEEEEEEERNASQSLISAKVGAEASPSSSSTSHEEDEDDEDVSKTATPPASHSNSSSSEGGESSSTSEEEEEEEEEASRPSRVTLRVEEEEEQQRKDNMRRLAAIQQKLKEAEEHKRLIQGALANLDTPTQGAGKHIVFGSDDEDEEENGEDKDQQQTPSEVTVSKKTLFQDDQSEEEAMSDEASANDNTVDKKLSGSQLFGGSEDEEESDEEENGNRFEIRPQFEGRAGQKLMALQSRFGTDERFRMDSRFLEEDKKEEESETKVCMTEVDQALEEERKKNLSILQSILGGSQETYSAKTSSKAKTFRDVSALHYDPSKEEHAAFETKPEETKESKSARRKKREEALKVPEVSKEIYYDVSGDLKAVFGPTKDDITDGEKNTSWDQEEEEVKGGKGETTVLSSLVPADPIVEKEESGFKFSFFGDDAETVNEETVEYKVESIQAPKVSWQQDLRFQDSSSEEDEDGQEEDEEQSRATPKTAEEVTPSKTTLFFFYPEDSRLAEGPRLFCRSSQLEEQREQWEERRSELRQEYRKKHKDARRKLKSSMKT